MGRSRYAPILAVALIAVAVMRLLVAGRHSQNADYAQFAHCPLRDPATDSCIFTQAERGKLVIGRETIPITRTMTLQGGIHEDAGSGKQELIAPESGATLSIASQPVPGGILAVIALRVLPKALRAQLNLVLDRGETDVAATPELAVSSRAIALSTQNLIEAKGIGLSLPLKVKLSNPFLGAACYIGSNAHPIVIALTTGTAHGSPLHEPIRGKPGHAKFEDDYNLITISSDSLVSTSFAAPRVQGCGGRNASKVDPAVNARLGLPVPAGGSEAILDGILRDATAPAVRAGR